MLEVRLATGIECTGDGENGLPREDSSHFVGLLTDPHHSEA